MACVQFLDRLLVKGFSLDGGGTRATVWAKGGGVEVIGMLRGGVEIVFYIFFLASPQSPLYKYKYT